MTLKYSYKMQKANMGINTRKFHFRKTIIVRDFTVLSSVRLEFSCIIIEMQVWQINQMEYFS